MDRGSRRRSARPGGRHATWRAARRALGLDLLVALAPAPGRTEPAGEIRMKVVGLKSDEGALRFGLYDRRETFVTSDGPIVKGTRPILNRQCEFVGFAAL